MEQVICVYISSKCNGKCSYCYLPNKDIILPYNEEIREWLSSDKYIEDIKKIYTDQIDIIGFWGAEPLFNLNLIDTDKLLTSLPKLKNIILSTGLTSDIDQLINFITNLSKSTKNREPEFLLNVQVSFDGNEKLNDASRGIGTLKKVLSNLKYTIDTLNNIDLHNLTIKFMSGSTISSDMLDFLNENWDEQFDFFKNLAEDLKDRNKNKNVYSHMILHNKLATGANITYTKEDGIKYSKIQSSEWEEETKNSPKGYVQRRFDLMNILKMCSICSAGRSSFGIAPDNSLHLCHRTFDYIVSGIEDIKPSMKNYVFYDKEKLQHYGYLVHSNLKFKTDICQAIIKELVECNEISSIYKNEFYSYMLARLVCAKMYCFMDNIFDTGSCYVPTVDLIKVYGNGALEYHIKDVMENL